MTVVDHDIVEMPDDPTVGAMPPYRRIVGWVRAETEGLTRDQLDVHRDKCALGTRSQESQDCGQRGLLPHRKTVTGLFAHRDILIPPRLSET